MIWGGGEAGGGGKGVVWGGGKGVIIIQIKSHYDFSSPAEPAATANTKLSAKSTKSPDHFAVTDLWRFTTP